MDESILPLQLFLLKLERLSSSLASHKKTQNLWQQSFINHQQSNQYLLSTHYVPSAVLSATNLTIGPCGFSTGKFESCHGLTADISYYHFMQYLKINHPKYHLYYVFCRSNAWNFIHTLLDQFKIYHIPTKLITPMLIIP